MVGDSQTRGLTAPLRRLYPGLRWVSTLPGANISLLSHEVNRCVDMTAPPDAVVVLGGICNVTSKDPSSGRISLRIPCATHAMLAILPMFKNLMSSAHQRNHNGKVILCSLYGVSLQCANHLLVTHSQQHICDDIIPVLNDCIASINWTLYRTV